jgi:hypothetical protein
MERRTILFGWLLAVACTALTGCELLNSQGLRKGSSEDGARSEAYEEYFGPGEDAPSDDTPEGLRGLFKPTKRPGGLSDEARQIERETFNIY